MQAKPLKKCSPSHQPKAGREGVRGWVHGSPLFWLLHLFNLAILLLMKIVGRIFGGLSFLFGSFLDMWDLIDFANLAKKLPQPPNVDDLVRAHILGFFIGTVFAIIGGYRFMKSR